MKYICIAESLAVRIKMFNLGLKLMLRVQRAGDCADGVERLFAPAGWRSYLHSIQQFIDQEGKKLTVLGVVMT